MTKVDEKPHHGSSIDPERQNAAHVHSVVAGRRGLFFACDLGTDEVYTYHLEPSGKLQELNRFKTRAGLGPRHSVVHPTKPFLYVVCEMGQVVLTFSIDDAGSLGLLQTLSLLQEGSSGEGSKAAEIVMAPDGSAVYATNRGVQNTVTTFAVGDNGGLEQVQQLPAPAYPRGMALSPDGSMLLVAGQSKTELATFRVMAGGKLEHGQTVTEGLPPNPAAFAVVSDAGDVEALLHE